LEEFTKDMNIKPSIAHRMAELTEEAKQDVIDAQILPLLAKVYAKIRTAVFAGEKHCFYVNTNIDWEVSVKLKKILKNQGFKVRLNLTTQTLMIAWKKSWIVSIMKYHTDEQL